MNFKIQRLLLPVLAILACSCAATSLKRTWKSPDYQGGPVQKIAVLAVDERGQFREILEGQFASQFTKRGQGALRVLELLGLEEIKADKQAAAARMRQAGADSILIVRLVDKATRATEVRQSGERYAGVTTGFDAYYDWYNYYTVAFMDMSVVRNNLKQDFYFESSLYDLNTSKRVWSGLTETTVKENADKLELVRPFASTVVTAMAKDGVIR